MTTLVESTENEKRLSEMYIHHNIEGSTLAFRSKTGYAVSCSEKSLESLKHEFRYAKDANHWANLCNYLKGSVFRASVNQNSTGMLNTLPPFKYTFTFLRDHGRETVLESICAKCFITRYSRRHRKSYRSHLQNCQGSCPINCTIEDDDSYDDLVRKGAIAEKVYAQRLFETSPWFATTRITEIPARGKEIPLSLEPSQLVRIYPVDQKDWTYKHGICDVIAAAESFPSFADVRPSYFFSKEFERGTFHHYSYLQLMLLNKASKFERGHTVCTNETIVKYLKTFDGILAWIKLLRPGCGLQVPNQTESDWELVRVLIKAHTDTSPGRFSSEVRNPVITCIILKSCYDRTNRLNPRSFRYHLAVCSWALFFLNLEFCFRAKYTFEKMKESFTNSFTDKYHKLAYTIRNFQLAVSKHLKKTPGTKTVSHNGDIITVTTLVEPDRLIAKSLNIAAFKRNFLGTIWKKLDDLWFEICNESFGACSNRYPLKRYSRDGPTQHKCLIDCGEDNGWFDQEMERIEKTNRSMLNPDNKPNYEKCQLILQKIFEWKRLMFVLLYFTTGAPLRAPEWNTLAVFLYHAGTELVNRSFYMRKHLGRPYMAIQTDYHKLRSQGIEKFSIRFVSPEVAERLVCYMRLVVPLIHYLANLFDKAGSGSDLSSEFLRTTFFFTYPNGERWNSDEFSETLREYTGIGIAASRQVLFHILSSVLRVKDVSITQTDLQNIAKEQADSSVLAHNANNTDLMQAYHYDRDPSLLPYEIKEHQELSMVHHLRLWNWWVNVPSIREDERISKVIWAAKSQIKRDLPGLEFKRNLEQSELVAGLIKHPSRIFMDVASTIRSSSVYLYVAPGIQHHLAMVFGPEKSCPVIVVSSQQSFEMYLTFSKNHHIARAYHDFRPDEPLFFKSFDTLNQSFVDQVKSAYSFRRTFTLIIDNVELLPLLHSVTLGHLNSLISVFGARITLMADYLTEYTSLWLAAHFPIAASAPRIQESREREYLALTVLNESVLDPGRYKKVLVFWDSKDYDPPTTGHYTSFHYESADDFERFKNFDGLAYLFIVNKPFTAPPSDKVGLIYQVGTTSMTVFRDRLRNLDAFKDERSVVKECKLISTPSNLSYNDWDSSDESAITNLVLCQSAKQCLHSAMSNISYDSRIAYDCTHVAHMSPCSVCTEIWNESPIQL